MTRSAFVVRLISQDEGRVCGLVSEPATGRSAGFSSLIELVRLLEGWALQRWDTARPEPTEDEDTT